MLHISFAKTTIYRIFGIFSIFILSYSIAEAQSQNPLLSLINTYTYDERVYYMHISSNMFSLSQYTRPMEENSSEEDWENIQKHLNYFGHFSYRYLTVERDYSQHEQEFRTLIEGYTQLSNFQHKNETIQLYFLNNRIPRKRVLLLVIKTKKELKILQFLP